MTGKRLALGAWGEEQAVAYLRQQGLTVLERNYRTPVGEIDIIASDRRHLVFVEVKTRSSLAFGSPQEAVGVRKQQQILRTAQWYMGQGKYAKLQPRFDVIAILGRDEQVVELNHLVDAFGLTG